MSLQIDKAEEFATGILQSQLAPFIKYHTYFHTNDVLQSAMALAKEEGITNENDLLLLKTAALFHDVGYTDGPENHEAKGCLVVEDILPDLGYSEDQIRTICNMIMKTKLPSHPETILEKILCDADLDYLGRDDFWELAHNLYIELFEMSKIRNEREWNELQVKFLQSHHYWTKSAHVKRDAKKAEHLNALKAKISR